MLPYFGLNSFVVCITFLKDKIDYILVYSLRKEKKSKSCYDPDNDEDIIKAIETSEEGKYSFNELKKELDTTSRTLTKHLNILEALKI